MHHKNPENIQLLNHMAIVSRDYLSGSLFLIYLA